MRVAVLVLGDVGRSPRMQYHALSLADSGAEVTLIGYSGERCVEPVERHDRITKHLFSPFAPKLPRKLFVVYAPFKVIFQIVQLFVILLFQIARPDAFLIQNPPSIPTLLVVWLVAGLRGARIVIDWHNLGFTILGSSLGERHVLVKVARWYEGYFSRKGDAHLCVTAALKQWLWENWQVRATVLYDKPPAFFRRTPLEARHELFLRLQEDFARAAAKFGKAVSESSTLFTTGAAAGETVARGDRPALVLSATSWTPDEDFGVLLEAIVRLDARWCREHETLDAGPKAVFVVTGKGPQKAMYQERMRQLEAEGRMKRTSVSTMWLEPSDYPLLLGSADLGVSLHTSTSGLDLPMKVLDMFGARMPVCAIGFRCLPELVKHGVNGMVFENEEELAAQFHELLSDFPGSKKLEALRSGIGDFANWAENWRENAAPVFAAFGPLESDGHRGSTKSD